jgi:tRNA-dihydrouridine synthase 1
MKETGCDGVMIAEPNLYNPALFSNLNPISWEIAEEYIKFVEKYPTNLASIRGHLFKIFHKVSVLSLKSPI